MYITSCITNFSSSLVVHAHPHLLFQCLCLVTQVLITLVTCHALRCVCVARGINEGREVENPAAIRAAEQAAKDAEEKERQAKIAAMEAERLEKERIERKKREEEARVKADKANPAAKADTSVVDRPVRQMVKLRSPTKSNEEVHPMLAGLDEVMPPQKGPKKKK